MSGKLNGVVICASDELEEQDFVLIDVTFEEALESVVVLRYQERVYAYLNRCVHMAKRLDCQDDDIFNDEWNLLRCSMHGFLYDPQSGECLSNLCQGERLCALEVEEVDGRVVLRDQRLSSA